MESERIRAQPVEIFGDKRTDLNLKIHSFCLDSGLLSTFALQMVEFPNKPCGLSRQQQRECEWRRVVRECE